MKCLVIDDEPMALEILVEYIKKVPFLECTGTFRDAMKALEYLQREEVDLLFLDINMPDLTGIQFLNSLSNQPLVIFTTAYSQYALESYDYDAVDYLLKPIEFDRFLKAVNKAQELYHFKSKDAAFVNGQSFMLLKSGTKFHRIEYSDIFFIRGTGNYVTFVTAKKDILSLSTMRDIMTILPAEKFFRIHRSYIVNLEHTDEIENDQVKIKDEYLPISDLYKDDFFDFIKGK